jgi:hypothetical protein
MPLILPRPNDLASVDVDSVKLDEGLSEVPRDYVVWITVAMGAECVGVEMLCGRSLNQSFLWLPQAS